MKRKFVFLFVIFISYVASSGYANNVKVSGEPVLSLNAKADSVEIRFNLSWQNSWRDEFNWDAAWVFVKFKRENTTTAWGHVNLGSAGVPSGLAFDFGKTGNKSAGVFIFRNAKGGGDLTDQSVSLTAALSEFAGVTADEIRNKKVYVAVSAVEMVYIPYGAYYLGDGVSKNSFKSVQQRIILPEDDIIGTDPKFTYTSFFISLRCLLP